MLDKKAEADSPHSVSQQVTVMPLPHRLRRISSAHSLCDPLPTAPIDVSELKDPPRKGIVNSRDIAA